MKLFGKGRAQTHVCPVCAYLKLPFKPYKQWPPPPDLELTPPYEAQLGKPSHEACPQCGFVFGKEDTSFEEYRYAWGGRGRPWADPSVAPPEDERRFAILGPGTYEGFDRPGLGEEVPEQLLVQAQRLEAAEDVMGLRRLVTRLARDGITGYDVVAIGGFAGSSWDFLGFDVDVQGLSALRHREEARSPYFSERLNEHGLLADFADVHKFAIAVSPDALLPIGRLRRSAVTPGDRLWYTIGNEHNPGDPFGRIVLTVEADGTAALEHYGGRNGSGTWTARVDTDVIARIRAELGRSTFPEVAREPIPAGSGLRQLEVVTDDEPEYVLMGDRQGQRLDGYKEAFALLDAIAIRITTGAYERGDDALDATAITDVRQIT
ncbi:hypothetical protein OJ997_02000 [Solirubrobacter phytolaccae]|uniref:Uncharacterized protein n=1 Tax=Solirubrobacter phytolaccae TaxID=1404360 RepID=A0A9X3NAD9_9ACTN|nr:hypothetical protein [Solirubrobacter phytolaccae]MDA0179052.1 hypothetical protein [Solirubrobacter phytolaccae]